MIDALREIIGKEITPESTLESLGIDSLDALELIFKIEERFNIRISNEMLEFKTIQDLIDMEFEHGNWPKLTKG